MESPGNIILSDEDLENHFKNQIKLWFSHKGDSTLRLDYQLDENAVVVDLGGYEGRWTEQIHDKYNCEIHVFEPVKSFYEDIKRKFSGNSRIHVYDFGLGDSDGSFEIFHSGDGTSMYTGDRQNNEVERIQIKSAKDFLDSLDKDIQLMKINIEGAEFDLLPHLIQSGVISRIENLQIQFHSFIPHCQQKRNTIQAGLSQTHELTYNYDFVWENWRIKRSLLSRVITALKSIF